MSNEKTAGNEIADFNCRLPHRLVFDTPWEVALISVTYPHRWRTTGTKTEQFIEVKGKNENVEFRSVFTRGMYEDAESIMQQLKKSLQTTTETSYDKSFLDVFENADEGAAFTAAHVAPPQQPGLEDISAFLSFCYDNEKKRFVYEPSTEYVKETIISPQLNHMLGFWTIGGAQKLEDQRVVAASPIDLSGSIDTLFIYTDIIKPQIVGSVCAPLLRACSTHGKHGEMIEESFVRPQYIDLLCKEIGEIRIQIRTDSGSFVDFAYGTVRCVLHFRQKSPF
jgi:hypothetical protein